MAEQDLKFEKQKLAAELELERQKLYVEFWSKVVDTQMHFNEMSVKSRQLGLTFIAAALGLGVVLITRGEGLSLRMPANLYFDGKIHVASLLTLAALLAVQAVRRLDLHVYHRMLRGAVSFGEDFERNLLRPMFHLHKGMTEAISHFSRFSDAKVEQEDGRNVYKEQTRPQPMIKFDLSTIVPSF